MTIQQLKDRWKRIGCGAQLLIVLFAFSVTGAVAIKIGQAIGLVERGNGAVPTGPERAPAFSRKDCIDRHRNALFDRNPDMTELTEDQIGIIAKACADEEEEYNRVNFS